MNKICKTIKRLGPKKNLYFQLKKLQEHANVLYFSERLMQVNDDNKKKCN